MQQSGGQKFGGKVVLSLVVVKKAAPGVFLGGLERNGMQKHITISIGLTIFFPPFFSPGFPKPFDQRTPVSSR